MTNMALFWLTLTPQLSTCDTSHRHHPVRDKESRRLAALTSQECAPGLAQNPIATKFVYTVSPTPVLIGIDRYTKNRNLCIQQRFPGSKLFSKPRVITGIGLASCRNKYAAEARMFLTGDVNLRHLGLPQSSKRDCGVTGLPW